ncbi:leucine-rich repeat-containing protein 26 [Antennarius striatus]|uniref:leucine-rich repeat-containing protein 26 n=1 Tax=Antennarius striatus TaxID=241820 RepID=UPI0035AE363A
MLHQPGAVLISLLLMKMRPVGGCVCPPASVLPQFPPEVPPSGCCLNYSGSTFGHVDWFVFANVTHVETLDLSSCNISSVETKSDLPTSLQRVYLGSNQLKTLPKAFLSNQPRLTELDLSRNQIQELPVGFLQDSDQIHWLNLQENHLRLLPSSVLLKPNIQRLELDGNPWECTCLLLERVEEAKKVNRTTTLQDLLGNFICVSPRHLFGRGILSVKLGDVCRPVGLTVLFIVLPLVILSALLLCWCCGRTGKRREGPVCASKKRTRTNVRNGQKQGQKQPPGAPGEKKTESCASEGSFKNQLLLCPASSLMGSDRDVYEEVVIKLGSVESTPPVSSRYSSSTEGRLGSQEPDGASRADLDTVSVTEVMKDSSDREKAYLTQSTEYYSLVPGMELDDSDHGEYEDVKLP